MISHSQIWQALDKVAEANSMTASGLARRSGLDSTTFNKSKRVSPNGKKRWPSTESVMKVLRLVDMSFEDFAALATDNLGRGPSIPVIGLAEAGSEGYFDDAGFPVGGGWEEIRVPGTQDDNVYALEISGDSMWPVFRDGDKILVAPNQLPRKGDRVVVKTNEGEILAKELTRLTASRVELKSINPDYEDREFRRRDVQWIARIVWASQ